MASWMLSSVPKEAAGSARAAKLTLVEVISASSRRPSASTGGDPPADLAGGPAGSRARQRGTAPSLPPLLLADGLRQASSGPQGGEVAATRDQGGPQVVAQLLEKHLQALQV